MPLRVLQSSPCAKACSNCSNALRSPQTCDGRSACPGYGTRANCPPLIVLASLQWDILALAAATPRAFGSMRDAHA
jgi:hypothetical protein